MAYNRKFDSKKNEANFGDGLTLTVINNDVAKAIRKLKQKVNDEGILQDYRGKQYFVKPSEQRRLAKKAGRKRWLKKKQQIENS